MRVKTDISRDFFTLLTGGRFNRDEDYSRGCATSHSRVCHPQSGGAGVSRSVHASAATLLLDVGRLYSLRPEAHRKQDLEFHLDEAKPVRVTACRRLIERPALRLLLELPSNCRQAAPQQQPTQRAHYRSAERNGFADGLIVPEHIIGSGGDDGRSKTETY